MSRRSHRALSPQPHFFNAKFAALFVRPTPAISLNEQGKRNPEGRGYLADVAENPSGPFVPAGPIKGSALGRGFTFCGEISSHTYPAASSADPGSVTPR